VVETATTSADDAAAAIVAHLVPLVGGGSV
jgi:hypothetical protein